VKTAPLPQSLCNSFLCSADLLRSFRTHHPRTQLDSWPLALGSLSALGSWLLALCSQLWSRFSALGSLSALGSWVLAVHAGSKCRQMRQLPLVRCWVLRCRSPPGPPWSLGLGPRLVTTHRLGPQSASGVESCKALDTHSNDPGTVALLPPAEAPAWPLWRSQKRSVKLQTQHPLGSVHIWCSGTAYVYGLGLQWKKTSRR
jgi:hypothetical protein